MITLILFCIFITGQGECYLYSPYFDAVYKVWINKGIVIPMDLEI